MHVLIVHQYALPAGAAGNTRHGDLGRELVQRGHRVTIIASRFNYLTRAPRESRKGRETIHGVNFHWLDTGSYAGNDWRRVRSMLGFMVRSAVEGLRIRPKPDVVIGSSPQLLAGLSALMIARRFRVPFILEVRDTWPSALVDLGALRAEGMANRGLLLVERLLYRTATAIIAVMPHVDRRVAEVGEDPAKCVHIPNASSVPPHLGPVPQELDIEFQRQAAAGRQIVIYAGAHGVSNGLHQVLDALTLLRDRDNDTYQRLAIFFVGDGPDKERLKRQVELQQLRCVYFHDPLPKASMLAAMSRSDYVLVHFARAEFKRYGMSANKLFDAMAVGRPVLLASPLTDTPVDLVRCGIRYEPGSIEALSEALSKAASTPSAEWLAMGERALAEATERYDLRVTGRQLEELLLEQTGRTAGPAS
jgi:glycosyltransferase involved in cell wall biosynthesis